MTNPTTAPIRSDGLSPHPGVGPERPDRRRSSRIGRLAALSVATLPLLVSGPAGAQDDTGDDLQLIAVQFDLAAGPGIGTDPGADDAEAGPLSAAPTTEPVRYATVQIEHRRLTRRLRPLDGSSTVTLAAGPADAVVAEIDGLRIGPSADGYAEALAGSVASPSLGRFARIDAGGADGGVVLDVDPGRPLGPDHYLLVQESGGDASIRIETLGEGGRPTGAVADLAAPYGWNTGQQAEPGIDLWATVIPVPLPVDGGVATGLRIRSTSAELKVVVLRPALAGAAAGTSAGAVAETSAAADTSTTTATTEPAVVPAEGPAAPVDDPDDGGGVEAATEPEPAPQAEPLTPGAETFSPPVEPEIEVTRAPTALAMTGVPTEPWVLVGLSTGFIFFGYTTVAAFRRPSAHRAKGGQQNGHAQLDALGFE